MTNWGRVVILLLFLSCVIIEGNVEVKVVTVTIGLTMRCSGIRYDEYDKSLDDVLNGIGQQVNEHHGLGFNTYYSLPSQYKHWYHGHACCHPTLIEEYCSRCIHDALDHIRHRCGRRIGGFVGLKDPASNYACEVRYERYDVDDDYFSCSRY